MMQHLSKQKKIGHFEITRASEIREIQSTLIELMHLPTGAQVMQIANDDEENLFNLSFRTWPEKSNGVAHILEHTVLCGSEHFPVRDPFFAMNRRSLNTFMNALTGPDFTCYPAASQVEKDFYNLLLVYLDAVFKPKLTELSFLQEGHRLEFMNPEDPNSGLLFRGIVYNEMKGAMATADARITESLMQSLFPHLTYGVNAGGDPSQILSLTYEELKAFHAKFYHPSRCLFYFYGNLPLEKHLDFLEKHALKDVEKLPPLPSLPKQPRFEKSVKKTLSYPISEEENLLKKTLIGMGWLTSNILEQEELLALNILDIVLMGTDAAPLKTALLKSNLCKQVDSLIDNEMSEIPFILICKGCEAENAKELENIVLDTLNQLVQKGLPSHLVDGALHQLEMSRTEITGSASPYGLHLFFRSALLKQHGGNPEDGLRVHTLFNHLRKQIEDPKFLTKIIEKHFLRNPHYVQIVMQPDKKLVSQEIKEEQECLEKVTASLKDTDVKQILLQSQKLAMIQEESSLENLDVLPKVTTKDVAKEGKEFNLIHEPFETFELFYHPCFTNEILYADLIFDLPNIEDTDLAYLRLFSFLLPQMGCGGRSYHQHLDYLLEHTGGISVSLDLNLQADNPTKMKPSLSIRGRSLYRKMNKFFPLLRDLISSADFTDISRLNELLQQHFHALENSIQQSSLRYAVNLASRGTNVASTIISKWHGLDYFWEIKKIVETFEKDPSLLIAKLQKLQNLCLALKGAHLLLSCDTSCVQTLKKEQFYGLTDIATKTFFPWKGEYPILKTESQARITASPVAFTALLFPSLSYVHPHSPLLSIASEIMENKVLHKRIREQGGAYGAGAVNGALSGQFYFYAYRDPNLSSSVAAFKEAIDCIANAEFTQSDIEEAKLGLFQDLDAPIAPLHQAITAYGRERTNRKPHIRQEFRKRLFKGSKKEIQKAAKMHLLPNIEKAILVCFAGKGLIEKENSRLEKPLPIYPV